MIEVSAIVLSNNGVHEPPSFFAAAAYQNTVRRIHHNQRNQSDMIRKSFVIFPVPLENLFLSALYSAINIVGFPIRTCKFALYHKKRGVKTDILRICRG